MIDLIRLLRTVLPFVIILLVLLASLTALTALGPALLPIGCLAAIGAVAWMFLQRK